MILKTSWGIVISLDIEEIVNPVLDNSDFKIKDRIYLRINPSIRWPKEFLSPWLEKGLKDLSKEIYDKIDKKSNVCFYVKDLDFNMAHFQKEGIYCAIQEWLAKYYNFEFKHTEVFYDKISNKYIFNIPS